MLLSVYDLSPFESWREVFDCGLPFVAGAAELTLGNEISYVAFKFHEFNTVTRFPSSQGFSHVHFFLYE